MEEGQKTLPGRYDFFRTYAVVFFPAHNQERVMSGVADEVARRRVAEAEQFFSLHRIEPNPRDGLGDHESIVPETDSLAVVGSGGCHQSGRCAGGELNVEARGLVVPPVKGDGICGVGIAAFKADLEVAFLFVADGAGGRRQP